MLASHGNVTFNFVDTATVLERMRRAANPANVAGMARYGINTQGTLGISMVWLRALAKELGRSHEMALELWDSGIHEARILATLIADPAATTGALMERWVRDLDSWDVCDQACQNLFRYAPAAFEKAGRWARARPEFTRRAGFVIMAGLAVKNKTAPDARFEAFLPLIAEGALDERNFVRKAVNWALRQIGKRNARLHRAAVAAALEIQKRESRAARWVAAGALRELRSDAVRARLQLK
jgi:3-methyladenine DNA glycosylase AlkD